MPSCLVLESITQDPVYKGGNHLKDPHDSLFVNIQ